MTERVFVDTNVWVYTVDAADSRRRDLALAATAPDASVEVVVSAQVLAEFYDVVTRKLERPLPGDVAALMVDRLAELVVVPTSAALVTSAIAASRDWGISSWDAMIVRAAATAGCRTLLTEDLEAGRAYGSVAVVDPFA